jgi:cysteinyl-tRNA synthetase
MEQAKAQWTTFLNALLVQQDGDGGPTWEHFVDVLEDDFNTPEALAVMHEWRRAGAHTKLRRALALFGLTHRAPGTAPMELRIKAEERQKARQERDFELADSIRKEIERQGWEVRDVSEPPGFQLVPR